MFLERTLRILLLLLIQIVAFAYAYDKSPVFALIGVMIVTVALISLDAQLQVVLAPRRVLLAQFEGWATRHLRASDQVVEATTNAWYIHDLLLPLVARVVADPCPGYFYHPLYAHTTSGSGLCVKRCTWFLPRLNWMRQVARTGVVQDSGTTTTTQVCDIRQREEHGP